MTIGSRWQRQAARAAGVRAEAMIDAAERVIGERLPDARIERSGAEVRLRGSKLAARWIGDPALRFLGRGLT